VSLDATTYRANGTVSVEFVCAQCEKRVWYSAPVKTGGDEPLWEAYPVAQGDGWSYADDCFVCSNDCAMRWWDAA